MTQNPLAQDARMGEFLKDYKPHTNINVIINSFTPVRLAFDTVSSIDIVKVIQFPDVSFYQGEINFDEMAKHTKAIILRIGQNVWKDEQFERNYREAKRVGLLVGGYYFYDDRVDPGRQAETCISALHGKFLELGVYIDWENSYGGGFRGLGNVVAMMEKVEQAGLAIREVGLYTGYYWFRENSNSIANASHYNYLKSHSLWEAWYTNNSANVLIPSVWTKITHWQFGTPAVNWGQRSAEIDMNYFNGTHQEFDERYGIGSDMIYETKVDAKLWRNSDGTSQISTIQSGTRVTGDAFTASEYVRLTVPSGYTKKIWLQPVTTPPPPPPPEEPTIFKTHQVDIYSTGKISVDGSVPF